MKECGACGKSNKDWATVCLCGEPFSDAPADSQTGQAGEGEATAQPATSTSGDSLMAKRYSNLAKAAKGLVTVGTVMKVAAFIAGLVGLIAALEADAVLLFALGAAVGVAFFGMGVLFAAIGEAALALGHIASSVAPEKLAEPGLDVEAATDPGQ